MSACEDCIHYRKKYSGSMMRNFASVGKRYCEIAGRYILSVEDSSLPR